MNTSPHGKWGRGIYTGDPPRMSVCITEQETYQNRLWHVLQRTVVEGWKADNSNSYHGWLDRAPAVVSLAKILLLSFLFIALDIINFHETM